MRGQARDYEVMDVRPAHKGPRSADVRRMWTVIVVVH